MSFNPKTLSLGEWVRLHYAELRVEFDQSNRYDPNDPIDRGETCYDCGGRGEFRNGLDELEECETCCGTGEIELTETDLFHDFCNELYYDQRNLDMKRYVYYQNTTGWA